MTEQVLRKCLSSSICSTMCELVVLGGRGETSLIIVSSLKKWQECVEFVRASLIAHSKYPHVSLLESHAASLTASHACIMLSPKLSHPHLLPLPLSFQTLYKTQVKELKEEIEEKNRQLQDASKKIQELHSER